MRIAFVTAGAAGMFCGSCMRDNTLVAALNAAGHDAILVPTYTPIRTDEPDVSTPFVFYGGINVYLEQKFWLFRHTPRFVDWLLARPFLLRWVSRFAVNVDYGDLGQLTVSMLRGRTGRQKKELATLIEWLKSHAKPEVVILTNALLSGMVPAVRESLRVPVLVTLQGDDIFLNALPEPQRSRCLELIRANDRHVSGYICTSRNYADFMAGYLGVDREKMHVVYPGINLKGHGEPVEQPPDRPPTIGYFARICPEKGFHNLIEAFLHLRRTPEAPRARLKVSGWLGANNRKFFDSQVQKLADAGLAGDFEHVECPDHASKVRFLQSIDLLSVPTDYHEPKGLYVLEAWANGVPVVQPRHGSFPELIESTGAGLLTEPGDHPGLAERWQQLLVDQNLRAELGNRGKVAVRERYSAQVMAAETVQVLEKHLEFAAITAGSARASVAQPR